MAVYASARVAAGVGAVGIAGWAAATRVAVAVGVATGLVVVVVVVVAGGPCPVCADPNFSS